MYLLCKFHSFRLLQSEGIENEEYKSSLERDNVNGEWPCMSYQGTFEYGKGTLKYYMDTI